MVETLTFAQRNELRMVAQIDALIEVRGSLFRQKDKLDKEGEAILARMTQADVQMKAALAAHDHHLRKLWQDVWLDTVHEAEINRAECRGWRNAFVALESVMRSILGE